MTMTPRLVAGLLLVLLAVGVVAFGAATLTARDQRMRMARRIDRLRGRRGDGEEARQSVGDITLRRVADRNSLKGLVDRLFGIDRSLITAPGIAPWQVAAFAVPMSGAAFWIMVPFSGLPPALGAAGALGALILAARHSYSKAKKTARGQLLDQFPDAIGLVVRAIRAGIPVAESIRALGHSMPNPTGPEFRRIADEIAVGVDLEVALWRLAERTGLPEFRFFVVAVVLQRETGGDLSETLGSLADVIRKRRAIRQRGLALSAEARTSSLVLAALPFFATGFLYFMNPPYIMRLFTTPDGKMLLGLAAVLLASGLLVIRAMIRKVLA